ncbi:MAG: hypothetical protein COX65_07285 [Elusimicrobia bacterium CG_4_10_14_0_2_um_filter_56_8]|nr:MAG: hypothetical protein AUJ51_04730 [Elusimicrobia bacterium CG1_02_56_21]PJA13354.1 MAG: hypothetical protein COX65_07285 [Elusimicrobia bacterium CG_4_10_14_0_2_um_filter_56_8]
MWQNLFKKRFVLNPAKEDDRPGEATYSIRDKQFVVVIRAATQPGALRAESVTDTEECLVINRGQGRYAFVDWNRIEAISTVDN